MLHHQLPWYAAGPLLGLCVVAGRLLLNGRLGVTGGYSEVSRRLAGLGIGLAFGVVLSWRGMTSPVVIRQALLFQRAYLFLFFASAVCVAAAGCWLLRRGRARALTGEAR